MGDIQGCVDGLDMGHAYNPSSALKKCFQNKL